MKKSVIRDILRGERGHQECYTRKRGDERKIKETSQTYSEINSRLNEEQLALFQKYVEQIDSEWCDEVDFYFVEGFKLGLLIGVECMDGE